MAGFGLAPAKREGGLYLVDDQCTKCGCGQLESTGMMKPMYPPLDEFRCNMCGNIIHISRECVHKWSYIISVPEVSHCETEIKRVCSICNKTEEKSVCLFTMSNDELDDIWRHL